MVWERIKELKSQEEQQARNKAAQEESKRRLLAQEARDAATKVQQKEQERIREVERNRRLTKDLLEKSGVLPGMREIEKGLAGNVRKHAIVENLDQQQATLAWGSKFRVVNKSGITYESHWLAGGIGGKMDYSYIRAKVNLSSESVIVGDKEVKKDQWSTNRAVIQELLAQAYVHPTRVNERDTPSKYSSSSSSSSPTECCNQ